MVEIPQEANDMMLVSSIKQTLKTDYHNNQTQNFTTGLFYSNQHPCSEHKIQSTLSHKNSSTDQISISGNVASAIVTASVLSNSNKNHKPNHLNFTSNPSLTKTLSNQSKIGPKSPFSMRKVTLSRPLSSKTSLQSNTQLLLHESKQINLLSQGKLLKHGNIKFFTKNQKLIDEKQQNLEKNDNYETLNFLKKPTKLKRSTTNLLKPTPVKSNAQSHSVTFPTYDLMKQNSTQNIQNTNFSLSVVPNANYPTCHNYTQTHLLQKSNNQNQILVPPNSSITKTDLTKEKSATSKHAISSRMRTFSAGSLLTSPRLPKRKSNFSNTASNFTKTTLNLNKTKSNCEKSNESKLSLTSNSFGKADQKKNLR